MPQIELPSDELLERYEHGELSGAQRAAFEERLLTDPALGRRLRDYRETIATLQLVRERRALREKLQSFHSKIEIRSDATVEPVAAVPQEMPTPVAAPVMTASVGKTTPKAAPASEPSLDRSIMRASWINPARTFLRVHRITMGVAASVAILSAFSTLFLTSVWKNYQRQSTNGYALLRREVESIKRTQRAMLRDINATTASPEAPLAAFSGTGFALSSNGFLVTSYHVVKDADSLLVEGGPDHARYRANTVYRDELHDLAILRITDHRFKSLGKLPYTFKKSDADLGERVYTLGYPREDVVYGEGALAARTGFEGDSAFYQVSVPVNPGNSGGPLLDDRGNMIGIISGRQLDIQSAAFAVKSSALLKLLENLPADDTATVKPQLPKANQLSGNRRPEQIRRLQDFVFVVKVYN